MRIAAGEGAPSELPKRLIDLDPELPHLATALEPAHAASGFERQALAPPIRECELAHVRWSPGVECVATYRLALTPSPTSSATSFGAVEVRPEGVRHWLYEEDAELPGLAFATDPAVMSSWLSEHLARHVDACTITPVRYRPGERCVLRYELPGPGNTVVYGKVLSGDRVADLAATLASIDQSLIAPPVGWSPEWQLLVQSGVGERNLKSVAYGSHDAEGLADVGAAGRLLARLHSANGPKGRAQPLAKQAGDLKQYLPHVERVSPAIAPLYLDAIGRFQTPDDLDGRVPSHGAFRLDQVHLSPAGPVLIDLDSYCWADPALDVGNLFAYLTWRGIRHPPSAPAMEEVRRAFLAAYSAAMAASLDVTRLWAFEATSLLKIAGRCYRKLAVGEWDLVTELIRVARTRLRIGAPVAP